MARDSTDQTPIESRDELVAWLEAGAKPLSEWRIGTEHEKFPFRREGLAPVPYLGEGGIEALLTGLKERLGWEGITDGPALIGLADPDGGGAISLEPGGQFELSGAPVETLHDTARELERHLADCAAVADPLGMGFLGVGMSPLWTREATPTMPKSRYKIMTGYMPKVGGKGLDMMYRTCTVQVNLDFASEADMVRKLRVGVALQPVATALFAASPFTEGRPNGYLSYRSEIWRDTDRDRTGMIPFAFEPGMGYERYADWALDVPMYFVKRGGRYHDVSGASFRDLLAGKLAALPGERATLSDWTNHLSTLFPEVRLKRYLEMRGADCGPARHLEALPAFWVGLLYDQQALDAAFDLVKDWTAEERQALRDAVPKTALATPFRRETAREVARRAVAISRAGLERRDRGQGGSSEARYLDPLDDVVERGRTLADTMLERFHRAWGGRIEPIFAEFAL